MCALPHTINKNRKSEFEEMSGLLNQMTEFMDKNFVDDKGESLFSDKDRDEKFGRVLQEQFGGKKFRGEAFTMVRQKVGQVRTDDLSVTCNNKFEKTQRHVDGQNDGWSSHNHSVVFSAMCCWNLTVC